VTDHILAGKPYPPLSENDIPPPTIRQYCICHFIFLFLLSFLILKFSFLYFPFVSFLFSYFSVKWHQLILLPQGGRGYIYSMLFMCQMRTAGVVDVVFVNIVTWSVRCERVGELAKGGAVVSRPGTRVDGYSPPRAKKLVLQVSKHGITGSKGLG
jgi:hypothetical protein